ncbi:class I SAM-dependent methyltransferase [Streptomyces lydicus]|uniref:class I SAM-dependent methyltransferase n=1 Tax=Streptomyces lydicus TaxID=47763 RepID=UPI00052433B2|nr:methyltransferase domain-containing protein [Streptomyces lydicus]MDC7341033.1 methyltransferase domain-containing protein [Streptomyces lydicus]UEG89284.1 class I SAM-dependent methyltransferase [Streptomyces lydicus]
MSTEEHAPEQPPGSGPRHEDPYAHALQDGRGPLYMRRMDGEVLSSEVDRWCAAPDPADMSVLRRCEGAVLDIGCGPGRLVSALRALGHLVLGIDINRAAVERTADTGGAALCRSVFERLPGEGLWNTALLMDGNIGIGGDPPVLLERIGSLVTPRASLLLVEAAAHDVDERLQVRFDDGHGRLGMSFPWARVGVAALRRTAAATGWQPGEHWSVGDRHFLELKRSSGSRPAHTQEQG